jgi:predicted RNase H-like nuclease
MGAILGIDAAWTLNGSSGVALVRETRDERWECVRVEASYRDFVNRPNHAPRALSSSKELARNLLEAAGECADAQITLVVADIPLARGPILGRRCADEEVSKAFGGRGCSTHSPSPERPGLLSEQLRDGFQECGFHLATSIADPTNHALIETYPHPALLSLMKASYRLKYKVTKTKKYGPQEDKATRMRNLLDVLRSIHSELSRRISGIGFEVPETAETFSELKPIEHKIDALVCAWVGIQVLDGKAVPYGDEEAAIWLPFRQT